MGNASALHDKDAALLDIDAAAHYRPVVRDAAAFQGKVSPVPDRYTRAFTVGRMRAGDFSRVTFAAVSQGQVPLHGEKFPFTGRVFLIPGAGLIPQPPVDRKAIQVHGDLLARRDYQRARGIPFPPQHIRQEGDILPLGKVCTEPVPLRGKAHGDGYVISGHGKRILF